MFVECDTWNKYGRTYLFILGNGPYCFERGFSLPGVGYISSVNINY